MKKSIIGISMAIMMVTFPVLAQGADHSKMMRSTEFQIDVGGYYQSMIYFVDSNIATLNNLQQVEDGEIHFNARLMSHSGVEYGVNVQLEASDQVNQIDEHYLYVKGDFGKIVVGAENSAAYLLQTHAPIFLGWKTYHNEFGSWRQVSDYQHPQHSQLSRDANKLTYFTPRVEGVQFGVSYTPDNGSVGSATKFNTNMAGHEVMSYGLSYKTKMADNHMLRVSFTGEVSEQLDGVDPNAIGSEANEYAVGIQYAMDKWMIGGNYLMQTKKTIGQMDDKLSMVNVALSYMLDHRTTLGVASHGQEYEGRDMSKTDVYVLGGSTNLARGVSLTYSVEFVEHKYISGSGKPTADSRFIGLGLLLKL